MTVDRPLVSVLAPAYNHGEFVESMARSVLEQTVVQLELLIVDDGSTDATPSILRKIAHEDRRVRPLRHLGGINRGVGAATVLAAREARGEVFALIDADDLWAPDKLSRQLESLEDGVTLSYARARCVDRSGADLSRTLGKAPHELMGPPLEAILRGNFVPKLTAVFPRDAYRRVGGIEPSQPFEDYDLWMRLLCLGDLAFVDRVLGEYRVSDEGRDVRQLQEGWDFRGALLAIDHLYEWPGLPVEVTNTVKSWRRAYRAAVDLIDGFGSRGLSALLEEDAPALMALLSERTGRLAALVDRREIEEWSGRLSRLGPAFGPVVIEVERQIAAAGPSMAVRSGGRLGRRRRRRALADAGDGLTGFIDEPKPGQPVPRGRVRVKGWALDDGRIPEAVLIRIDGVIRAAARVGLPRPDVAAAFPGSAQSGRAGWSAEVDLGESRGETVIEVCVLRAGSALERLSEVPVKFLGISNLGLPVGEITHPRPSDRISGDLVLVAGWALCASSPVARVEVLVDRERLGNAGLGRPTPKLFEAVPLPAAAIGGFELLVDPGDRSGEIRIGAVVHTLDGGFADIAEVPVVVENSPVQASPSKEPS